MVMIRTYGASQRGPQHIRSLSPNQDAWIKAEGRFGSLIAVCDGVGSRELSHLGAKAACLAVKEAIARWSRQERSPASLIIRLIELYWRLRIAPHAPEEVATTCLFALHRPDGSWIVGGLGDGLLGISSASSWTWPIGGREASAYANETEALGARLFSKKWFLQELHPSQQPRSIILATDGISDDLKANSLDLFGDWFLNHFGPMEPAERWRGITKMLRDWPTPKHLDDKTIAVIEFLP